MLIQPVILSGGSGTRLWPLSREHYPKQLLSFLGEQSLLQATIDRLTGLDTAGSPLETADPLLICNEEHRFLVAEQVRQLEKTAAAIILEPVGKNTAPALTLAALAINNGSDKDPVMLVMPADHMIRDISVFHDAVRQGCALAEQGYLVTFGIVPDSPETGYGYIKQGAAVEPSGAPRLVAAFVEKPDAAMARQYVDSGKFFWNSGIFMMKASTWLAEIGRYRHDIALACEEAFRNGSSDQDFYRIDKKTFSACPADSIDYAVMEKAAGENGQGARAAVIPLDAGWSDVGAWSALWEVSVQDADGNVIKGDVYSVETRNSLMIAENRMLAAIGLEDMIVIETADAVMVLPKSHAQQVKHVVERLKTDKRTEHMFHRKVYRPWGSYEGIDNGDRFQVKRIIVRPGASLSLQMHHHRAEHWIVVKGTARVTRGDEEFLLSENESTYIPIGTTHRLANPGSLPLELIEVQSGSYLGEDDIVRFDDVYGRARETKS